MEFVKQAWDKLIKDHSLPADQSNKFWKELSGQYTKSNRYYHDLSHVENLLRLADSYHEKIEDHLVFRFSIFYHDLIYSATRKDNELKSAQLARQRMANFGVSHERASLAYQYILDTQHNSVPFSKDSQFLVDMDLQILGESPERYKEYTIQV